MKKSLLIFFLIFSKSFFSQNGWNAYLGGASASFLTGPETCIAIDKNGNKWIGFTSSLASSPAALARFDKATGFWTHFNTANTPVIPNNRISCIACDNAGNVWAGTSAGLLKFDGANWTCYTTANGLPTNNIISLECNGNNVFIGTTNGLCRLNGGVFTNYNISNGLLPNDTVNCIKSQSATQIWLGNYNRIIEVNFNASFSNSSYNIHQIPFVTNKINCIFIDNLNKKWLGTVSKGLVEYDNTNFILASSTYSDMIGVNTPTSNCLDICKGPNNGPLVYATSAAYGPYTPGSNSSWCLLELLPNNDYKVYYVPNNNYTFGDYLEADPNGEIFISNKQLIHLGGYLKYMFSFKPWEYKTTLQGPGQGVTNKNYKYLDVNRVRAGIGNRGDMFWDLGGAGNARYEVPKGSGAHGGFCNSFWIGGLDASNQLHISAQTYRQTGGDFWPGPLDTINASCDTNTFVNYDKIWKISYNDINDFRTNFLNGNIANNTYTPTIDIITWPAHGNGKYSRNLAPFVDMNGNGIYDPLTGGDYPRIKGEQTLYFIFNDNFTTHTEAKGLPMGVEVHCMAYAYGCPNFINGKNELAYTTFYNYRIINRSHLNYHNVKIALFDDVDLGNYQDDYMGCHVSSNLGFSYNADGLDENVTSLIGYGNYPPATGKTFLKGPLAPANDGLDNDNDGITDELNEESLLDEFIYYNPLLNSNPSPTQPPSGPYEFFNYMNARWRDSTFYTCGGNGYGGITPTRFLYPWTFYNGMPCSIWSDNVNPKGDRRHIMSTGAFNLNSKSEVEFEFAKLWSVDSTTANDNIGAVTKLISDAQKVITFYKSGVQSTCLPNMAIGINENQLNKIEVEIYPNPVQDKLHVKLGRDEKTEMSIRDVMGKTLLTKIGEGTDVAVDVKVLSSGVYFLHIRQNGIKTVRKFIKQ